MGLALAIIKSSLLWLFFVTFIVGWPMFFFMTVMAFDAPDASLFWGPWILVLVITLYPVVFGLSYYFLNGTFLHLNRIFVLTVCIVVPLFGFSYLYGSAFIKFLFGIK